jgi:hypothetical protein
VIGVVYAVISVANFRDDVLVGRDNSGGRRIVGCGDGTLCTAKAVSWSLHVTLGQGWAGVKVLGDSLRGEIRAPFEAPLTDCFQ